MSVLDYIMGLKAGEASGGGSGTNIDVPVFTATYDSDWQEIQSITCSKTLAECYEGYENGQLCAILIETDGSEEYYIGMFAYATETVGADLTSLTYVVGPDASADVVYSTTGIEYIEPSGYPEELIATENGEYYAETIYKTVTVEVP